MVWNRSQIKNHQIKSVILVLMECESEIGFYFYVHLMNWQIGCNFIDFNDLPNDGIRTLPSSDVMSLPHFQLWQIIKF